MNEEEIDTTLKLEEINTKHQEQMEEIDYDDDEEENENEKSKKRKLRMDSDDEEELFPSYKLDSEGKKMFMAYSFRSRKCSFIKLVKDEYKDSLYQVVNDAVKRFHRLAVHVHLILKLYLLRNFEEGRLDPEEITTQLIRQIFNFISALKFSNK